MARNLILYLVVFCAGFAALSWEIIWQLKLSLAIGYSSAGTALTLATTMGGMTLGSLLMGRYMRLRPEMDPVKTYAALETLVGLSGLLLTPGFKMVEVWDAEVYQMSASLAPAFHVLVLVLLLGIPTLCLGATIPVFAKVSQLFDVPLSWLYGTNTAGASFGCLGVAFVLLPDLGVQHSIFLISGVNFAVALVAFFLAGPSADNAATNQEELVKSPFPFRTSLWLVFLTGFTTFALEIAWFRSFKAAFGSRTESFALMLSAVLIGLAVGARLARRMKGKPHLFYFALCGAGTAILLATPVVERFDLLPLEGTYYWNNLKRFSATLLATAPAIISLGLTLPGLLDSEPEPSRCSKLYAFNTLGAIAGALVGAWLLIPALGFARTSWVLGALVASSAVVLSKKRRGLMASVAVTGLVVAVVFESGIGRDRIQVTWYGDMQYKILGYAESPESTISVVEANDRRDLVIDGFVTTGDQAEMTHYMKWMGHLPMILHPHPKDTLVICYGTGQTANALFQEGAERVDVVDLNAEVLEMAPFFEISQNVLEKENVHPHVMDGRAWLRRSPQTYDVITLEPMAPTFAGVNNLYSYEFYELCRERLNERGIACQWLPFHLLHPRQTLMVASTFREVFPNCGLWLDPVGYTGLLVGVKDGAPMGAEWPGLAREVERSLNSEEIKRMMVLDSEGMKRLTRNIPPITDDNQELAYGSLRLLKQPMERKKSALNVIHWASTDPPPKPPDYRKLLDLRVEVSELEKN